LNVDEKTGATDREVLATLARQVLEARGFLVDMSPGVRKEVAGLGGPASTVGLKDLRGLPWCSIDNDDSRDLDQLTCAEAAGDGDRIYVAVADVDEVLPRDGPSDRRAMANTTSLYPPARMIPMLDEGLSTDLTSLNEGQDRAAVVVAMEVGPHGRVQAEEVFRAQVRNKVQLAYDGVACWLDGDGRAPPAIAKIPGLPETLRRQDRVARRLRTQRARRGALELSTIEPRAVFVAGAMTALKVEVKNSARRLIEDFMIAANVVVARFLDRHGFPVIRRVVRTPDRWERIVDVAHGLGHELPPMPDQRSLQRFLDDRRRADPLRFPDLSLTVVKLLGSGEYVAEMPGDRVPGHFALAVKDYTHSTAPNRRYPDLVTQRLVKAALAGGKSVYGAEELKELAAHCTWREDEAARAERHLRKSATALLMSGCVGEAFDALVTGVKGRDAWIRLLNPPAEGKLVRRRRGLDVGDRLRVRLVATNVPRGHLDFEGV